MFKSGATTTNDRTGSTPAPRAGRSGGKRWAIVLAAGDGTRLEHLTADAQGRPTPKQFCSVSGGPTLLQETLARGADLVGAERVVTVVAAKHAAWWRHDTAGLSPENVVVQPLNRGTAAGILLPLLAVARRDPDARVVVLPSDHFIERETVLANAARDAFDKIEREPRAIVLLGITPDRPDSGLGWILPTWDRTDKIARVERFVEKPPVEVAAELQRRGGVWNSFIFVARATTLLALYWRSAPALFESLVRAVALDAQHGAHAGAVESAYRRLTIRDFSRDLLEVNAAALRVLKVGPCGWSDLGTPERLARCAGTLAATPATPPISKSFRSAPMAMLRPVLTAVM